VAPGNFFDSHNAATAAVDAAVVYRRRTRNPHRGMNSKAPFGELVVTGSRQMAARAGCGKALARSHGDFDALLVGTEVDVLVDKTPETMAAV
jgi:hypothetical protein